MLTHQPPAPRRPQLGDADYDATAFLHELSGGSLRWIATILAVVAALFLASILAGNLPAESYWPVRARGTTATVLVVVALVFWCVIAVVNWRSHARRRHR